jgi:hypothetical protein
VIKNVQYCMYLYIYIYIYIKREIGREKNARSTRARVLRSLAVVSDIFCVKYLKFRRSSIYCASTFFDRVLVFFSFPELGLIRKNEKIRLTGFVFSTLSPDCRRSFSAEKVSFSTLSPVMKPHHPYFSIPPAFSFFFLSPN